MQFGNAVPLVPTTQQREGDSRSVLVFTDSYSSKGVRLTDLLHSTPGTKLGSNENISHDEDASLLGLTRHRRSGRRTLGYGGVKKPVSLKCMAFRGTLSFCCAIGPRGYAGQSELGFICCCLLLRTRLVLSTFLETCDSFVLRDRRYLTRYPSYPGEEMQVGEDYCNIGRRSASCGSIC